jgi:hypothetical protein
MGGDEFVLKPVIAGILLMPFSPFRQTARTRVRHGQYPHY